MKKLLYLLYAAYLAIVLISLTLDAFQGNIRVKLLLIDGVIGFPLLVGLINSLVEFFIVDKPITKEHLLRDKSTPITSSTRTNNRSPIIWDIKKAYRTLIRVIVFIGVYIPLFTIPFYSRESYLTPVVILIAFFLSRPLAKAIISKWLPSLNN